MFVAGSTDTCISYEEEWTWQFLLIAFFAGVIAALPIIIPILCVDCSRGKPPDTDNMNANNSEPSTRHGQEAQSYTNPSYAHENQPDEYETINDIKPVPSVNEQERKNQHSGHETTPVKQAHEYENAHSMDHAPSGNINVQQGATSPNINNKMAEAANKEPQINGHTANEVQGTALK